MSIDYKSNSCIGIRSSLARLCEITFEVHTTSSGNYALPPSFLIRLTISTLCLTLSTSSDNFFSSKNASVGKLGTILPLIPEFKLLMFTGLPSAVPQSSHARLALYNTKQLKGQKVRGGEQSKFCTSNGVDSQNLNMKLPTALWYLNTRVADCFSAKLLCY